MMSRWAALVLALPFTTTRAAPSADATPAMPDDAMSTLMEMNDAAAIGKAIIDQLEIGGGNGQADVAWDAQAWYGGDYDKAWFKTEGSPVSDSRDSSRNELLWDHALTRWWDLQAGVLYDLGHGPGRAWGALGVEGLAPYWFDVEATVYVGGSGRTAARLQVEHDLLITQRLILQPEVEANFYGKSDADRGVGSGLSDLQLGLRLRYELRREVAPYVGLAWRRDLDAGATNSGRRPAVDSLQWVAGIHLWL